MLRRKIKMISLFRLFLALPEILKLIISILDRVKKLQSEAEVKTTLKNEIKVINEAFKDGDASKLDKLWASKS